MMSASDLCDGVWVSVTCVMMCGCFLVPRHLQDGPPSMPRPRAILRIRRRALVPAVPEIGRHGTGGGARGQSFEG